MTTQTNGLQETSFGGKFVLIMLTEVDCSNDKLVHAQLGFCVLQLRKKPNTPEYSLWETHLVDTAILSNR